MRAWQLYFRAFLSYVVTILFGTLMVVVSLVSLRKLGDILPLFIRPWAWIILAINKIEVEFEGAEYLKGRKSRIVVLNHQSALDLVWPALIFPPRSFAVGKRELKLIPGLNILWWGAKCEFIDRQNREKAILTMQRVAKRIKTDQASLFIAPEGTRSPTGEILPFKKGAFRVACDNHIPIYPIVVKGAFELMPKTSFVAKPGKIKVKCLPPVSTEGWSHDSIRDHINEIRDLMIQAI